jgi:hypothetical protein
MINSFPTAEGLAKNSPSAGGRLGPVYLTTPGQGPVFPKNENGGVLFRTRGSVPYAVTRLASPKFEPPQ